MSTRTKSEPEQPEAPKRQSAEEVFAAQLAAEEAIVEQGRRPRPDPATPPERASEEPTPPAPPPAEE
jgi:hypothetical protein